VVSNVSEICIVAIFEVGGNGEKKDEGKVAERPS
jgi:hypothetical protein